MPLVLSSSPLPAPPCRQGSCQAHSERVLLEDLGLCQRCPHGLKWPLCVPLAGTLAQAKQEPSAPSCPQPARAVQHVQGKTCTHPSSPSSGHTVSCVPSTVPIGGQCLGCLPVQGARQVVYGICKSRFAKPGSSSPGEPAKGSVQRHRKSSEARSHVNPRRVLRGQAHQGPRGSGQWTSPLGRADQVPFLRARAEVACDRALTRLRS